MSDKKISELDSLTTANDNIEFIINDAGTSKKIKKSDIFTTNMDVAGTITADGLSLGDNQFLKLGLGGDLKIWHDGLNSYIKDHDAGDLFIQGSTTVTIEDVSGNNMAVFNDGASVDLYYGATRRFSTTNSGIDVEGTITASLDLSSGRDVYVANGRIIRFTGGSAGATNKIMFGDTAGTSGDLSFIRTADSSEHFRITGSGKVGIGTNIPSAILDVRRGDASGKIAEFHNNVGYGIEIGSSTADAYISSGYNQDFLFQTGTTATTRMTITSAGNVGIGVTPESDWSSVTAAFQIGSQGSMWEFSGVDKGLYLSDNSKYTSLGYEYINSSEASLHIQQNGIHYFRVAPSGTANSTSITSGKGYTITATGGNFNTFGAANNNVGTSFTATSTGTSSGGTATQHISWTTAMTINNSGNLLVGTTSVNPTEGMTVAVGSSTKAQINHASGTASGAQFMEFRYAQSEIGKITQNGTSSVSYNTSSDYRLKENVAPMSGSIDRLKELKPSRFNFIADADTTVDGFLAHEAQAIVPECVTGTKDAVKMEEYEVTPALGDVFTPAVEEVSSEQPVMETVEGDVFVNLAGETITETSQVGVTTAVTETVIERQSVDGVLTEVEVEKITQSPVLETVVTTEAVAEIIISSNVEKPAELTDGQQWREVTPAITGEREVPDMQGIDQAKLVPLLASALQEAVARIEQLENA